MLKNSLKKARPILLNKELLDYFKKEIEELLSKNLIRPSKSPWSSSTFYVQNSAEIERGSPILVINYKALNKVLQWIRYPLPNKRDPLKRIYNSTIYSKYDIKSGFWQVQIHKDDKYNTVFNVPLGQYKWNVMPFVLKNVRS